MTRYVVDTNVPIVANGRSDAGCNPPSLGCRLAAVDFLVEVLDHGRIVVDLAGEIVAEYRRKLCPSGQPGVGDRFYRAVLNSAPRHIQRVDLQKTPNGDYADFPVDERLDTFDPSDRKFAALSRRERIPVVNATDSDWLQYQGALADNGIDVLLLCGCDTASWFVRTSSRAPSSRGRR